MSRILRRAGSIAAACAIVTVIAASAACRAADPPSTPAASGRDRWPAQLTIGVAADTDGETPLDNHRPIAERIERTTGRPVKFFVSNNYSAIVQAMQSKRIDGMQLGVFSYLLAAQHANAEAVAVFINTFAEPAVHDPALERGYYSIIMAKKGSGVASLADLKGKTFSFGDPASTSGHLVPKAELMRAGLVPDRDLRTRFAGDHASAMVSLWYGHADGASVSESNLRGIVENGLIEYCGFPVREIRRARSAAEIKTMFDSCPNGKIVPIHYSSPIPGTPFALRRDLPDDLKAAIKAALVGTAGDPEFIRSSKRWYVDPSADLGLPNLDAYYDSMREVARLLDLDLRKMQ